MAYRPLALPVLFLVTSLLGAGLACGTKDPDPAEVPGQPVQPEQPGVTADGAAALGPSCDEDNPIRGAVSGTVDRTLPEAIVQFERQLGWGCAHREWHETRQWDYLAVDPKRSKDFAYVNDRKWMRAKDQEGAPGSGLDFLAMHRAMVRTLRDKFPQQADLFKGWSAVPTSSNESDPLPPGADGGAPTPFYVGMKQAIARLETDPMSFPSDDELGRFIETRHRPTADKPFEQTQDLTSGVHAFIHSRFDDVRSPIHMELFNRNIENETFFRFHGWIDRIWSQWRAARGLDDATDTAYTDMMHHACMHMGLMTWDLARGTCTM